MNKLPERKPIRLKSYDYSLPGRYFITICIKNRMPILWNMNQITSGMLAGDVPLSALGKTVEKGILQIPQKYKNVKIDKYCIMPEHIHILLLIDIENDPDDIDQTVSSPTVSTMIGSFKRWVSKEAGRSLWQKSFIDHIIRNDKGYRNVWNYIENNPMSYTEDDIALDFLDL